MTFDDLGLTPELLASIKAAGYLNPTPIQERSIPLLLAGNDLIGLAQTGTGKTAAYGLPLIQNLLPERKLQALVMAPTRELAMQVAEQIQGLAPGKAIVPVFGGQPIVTQFKALRGGAHVVVGTPGRVLDHLRRGTLNLENISLCVLDEADEMLNFGFQEEMEAILAQLPAERQVALFSATMSPRILTLVNRFLPKAKKVEIAATSRTVDRVDQSFIMVRPGKKPETLGRVLDFENPGPSLVFCRTRQETIDLTERMRGRGYQAESLHGDMAQTERERVMDRFRNGTCQLLIATDVAARGLDIENVTHVINYSIPWDIEQYVHRVGRTARAGKTGIAITLIEPREQRSLQRLERMSGAPIKPRPIPTVEQIAKGRRQRFMELIKQQIQLDSSAEQLPLVGKLSGEFPPEAIAAAALQALWERLGFAAQAQLSAAEEELGPKMMANGRPGSDVPVVWLGVSIGWKEGIKPADLIGVFATEGGLQRSAVGKIKIEEMKSFVEVPADQAERVIESLRRFRLKGKRIRIDLSRPPMEQRPPFRGKPRGNFTPRPAREVGN